MRRQDFKTQLEAKKREAYELRRKFLDSAIQTILQDLQDSLLADGPSTIDASAVFTFPSFKNLRLTEEAGTLLLKREFEDLGYSVQLESQFRYADGFIAWITFDKEQFE